MNTETHPRDFARKSLAKKPRNMPFPAAIKSILTEKSMALSHGSLRDRTLQHHLGKLLRPSTLKHQEHGIEVVDDVIMIGRDGHRIPKPSYATLRIDQLPQFRKG